MQTLFKLVCNFAQSIGGVHPSPDHDFDQSYENVCAEFDNDDHDNDYDNHKNYDNDE